MTPTPVPAGVSGADLNNYLLLFRDQGAIVALFLACAIVGFLLRLVTGGRRWR